VAPSRTFIKSLHGQTDFFYHTEKTRQDKEHSMRGMNLKVLSVTLTLILLGTAGLAVADAPTDAVKGTVDQVIRLLSNPALKEPGQKNRILQQVRQVVDRRFDYEEMPSAASPTGINSAQPSAGNLSPCSLNS
jgi:hypothetical protein